NEWCRGIQGAPTLGSRARRPTFERCRHHAPPATAGGSESPRAAACPATGTASRTTPTLWVTRSSGQTELSACRTSRERAEKSEPHILRPALGEKRHAGEKPCRASGSPLPFPTLVCPLAGPGTLRRQCRRPRAEIRVSKGCLCHLLRSTSSITAGCRGPAPARSGPSENQTPGRDRKLPRRSGTRLAYR